MIDRSITTQIDPELCTGCGACVEICPNDTIELIDGKAAVTGRESMNCDHCAAVCPTNAITVWRIDKSLSTFATFKASDDWLPFGKFDTPALVNLMQSRRSCRHYHSTPVAREILEDLVKIGITAPSGTNAQLWTFTILPDRESVLKFGNQVARLFQKINRLAKKSWLRLLLKMLGKPKLSQYFERYFESVQQALADWREHDIDLLFHGAPAVVVVGAKKEASCGPEDALLATQNILLAAHSIGLGSCLVGYAVEALQADKSLRRYLEIPDDEMPYAVIALGFPDEKFERLAGRKTVMVRLIR